MPKKISKIIIMNNLHDLNLSQSLVKCRNIAILHNRVIRGLFADRTNNMFVLKLISAIYLNASKKNRVICTMKWYVISTSE